MHFHAASQPGFLADSSTIAFRPERVASLGGTEIAKEAQTRILRDLGFVVDSVDEHVDVKVPSWRADVEGEACLVEEFMRVHGYDAIPQTPLTRESDRPESVLTDAQRLEGQVRRALSWRGLDEAVTFSFISQDQAKLFGGG